jgi:CDP-glucose 4,6-dehydratase
VDFGSRPLEDLVTPNTHISLTSILQRTYRGEKVLVTGHNGFVGSWLTLVLASAGAEVTGLSLACEPGGLAEALHLADLVNTVEGDIRDLATLQRVFANAQPTTVFHLAAQAKVLDSFADPLLTFDTNVMGTANVLESLRQQPSVRSCIVVTSDKCYATGATSHVETDPLGGDDPYSASKAAAELVAHAYRTSFFTAAGPAVATTRAGNILGGGDWAEHRIVPDCVRAFRNGKPVVLRRPEARRPWQHVLDAVAGYVRLGDALSRDGSPFAQAWNFGPASSDAVTVRELVTQLTQRWRQRVGDALDPEVEGHPLAERSTLVLDSGKAHAGLGWRPILDLASTIDWTITWYGEATTSSHFNARTATLSQIEAFLKKDGEVAHRRHN